MSRRPRSLPCSRTKFSTPNQVARLVLDGYLILFANSSIDVEYPQFMVLWRGEDEIDGRVWSQQICNQDGVCGKFGFSMPAAVGVRNNVCEEINRLLGPDGMLYVKQLTLLDSHSHLKPCQCSSTHKAGNHYEIIPTYFVAVNAAIS